MRLRRVLMLAFGAAAVVVSWTRPESSVPARDPVIPVSTTTACAANHSAPPSYGTRSLSNGCAR